MRRRKRERDRKRERKRERERERKRLAAAGSPEEGRREDATAGLELSSGTIAAQAAVRGRSALHCFSTANAGARDH